MRLPVDLAELLVRDLQPEHNEYRSSDPAIHWRGIDGAEYSENHSDCSAFLTLLLQKSYRLSAENTS